MRPDLERALKLNPRIRKKLREQLQRLERAVAGGIREEIVSAAESFVEIEAKAAADIARKRPEPRRHLIKFRVSDDEYANLAATALEHRLDPNEVARRYFSSGRQFERFFWAHIRRGGVAGTLFAPGPSGENILPGIILPDFSRREA